MYMFTVKENIVGLALKIFKNKLTELNKLIYMSILRKPGTSIQIPNSKFEIYYLEFQIQYSEFQICYSEFQICIRNSE